MQYFSTNRRSASVGFREAVLRGQPDDRGLYFPESIPQLPTHFFSSLGHKSNAEIAFEIIRPFVGGSIPDDGLERICNETINFQFPLVPVTDSIFAFELFHGPTLAFKDVGARFMSRCLHYFSSNEDEKAVVVVATSGDTGGAVADSFHGMDGVEVVILYPKGRVSRVQALQLTTFGGNVTTLEIRGSFDDCQALAKRALSDSDLKTRTRLTSANSINIARWLPQQFYYFYALREMDGAPATISVPSGNFGNLAAGLLACRSGLPVRSFMAACNANDVVPEYLETGELSPRPAVATLSNAMDVGDPSNLVRVMELFDRDLEKARSKIAAVSVSDEQTRETMVSVHARTGYVLDPHGAVGFAALADERAVRAGSPWLFMATAHPIKFDIVSEVIGDAISVPDSISRLEGMKKHAIEVDADYDAVRETILSKI